MQNVCGKETTSIILISKHLHILSKASLNDCFSNNTKAKLLGINEKNMIVNQSNNLVRSLSNFSSWILS